MDQPLAGKWVVISGGTKGIGRASAELFAKKGYNIITCSRHQNDLTELTADFALKYPDRIIHTVRADLSSRQGVNSFSAYIMEQNITIDVLINNAGYFEPGLIHEEKEGALESMMNTNLYSVYHLIRALVPSMKSKKYGDIFNICSIASIQAYPNGGSYGISKFALLGLTKGLREELKSDGIRVSAVLPGATLTASWEGVDLPKERFMKPEDVALAIWSAHHLSRQTVMEEIIIRPQLGDI